MWVARTDKRRELSSSAPLTSHSYRRAGALAQPDAFVDSLALRRPCRRLLLARARRSQAPSPRFGELPTRPAGVSHPFIGYAKLLHLLVLMGQCPSSGFTEVQRS